MLVASHGLAHDLTAQYHEARNEPDAAVRDPDSWRTHRGLEKRGKRPGGRHAGDYGPQSPMLRLWVMMRALGELRFAWTKQANAPPVMPQGPDAA